MSNPPSPGSRRSLRAGALRTSLLGLTLLAVVAVVGVAASALWLFSGRVPSGLLVTIPPGSSALGVGQVLREQGADVGAREFRWAARILGKANQLQAGVYRFAPGTSLHGMVAQLADGRAEQLRITLIEGLTFAEILQQLQATPELRAELPSDPRQAGMVLAEQLMATGAPFAVWLEPRLRDARTHADAQPLEGLIFPDTYHVAPGSSEADLLRLAIRLQIRLLSEAWEARSPRVAVESVAEALVLASVVEKETQVDFDRERVAAVFYNRLRLGMPLQSDPTTIYGLGARFDGNLRRDDLASRSRFNTYQHRGLPPHPIANPGRAAVVAALNPSPHRDLYFVARGNGRSYFSPTLEQHNTAVAYFQRGRGSPPPEDGQ